jgi:L-fucose isomerase
MSRIAVLSVSDGRESVHRDIESFVRDSQDRVTAALRALGHDVEAAPEIVWSNESAVATARALAANRPDLTIVNIPVWAFPHFTLLAARETPGPLALFSNVDPTYPGMVGMLAAGGGLDQIGRLHSRAWGDVADEAVVARLDSLARSAAAVHSLRGTTFGRIGGRPMGMYTAVSNTDQWMREFGVDVEEIDQYELVRRADAVSPAVAASARRWLEERVAAVNYDGDRLTPEILERQIRVYVAMRELIDEHHLDFCGIKAQPELTNHYCTADVAEAFLNDPYDWDGAKEPLVCATEADMDAALTMQILKSLSGTPVLFADVRHYHADLDIWDLCNSGQHATWFAARSNDADENLRRVTLHPEAFYFPAGGAAVHHVAVAGDMTFARLTRLNGNYRMQVLRGRFEEFPDDATERLMRASTYEWPHAFTHFDAPAAEILDRYGSNHIHAIPGDHVDELRDVCRLLGAEFDGFGLTAAPRSSGHDPHALLPA